MAAREYEFYLRVFNSISISSFSEDFRRFSQIFPKARRTFSNFLRTFSEDCRGRTDGVSIIQQDI